MKRIAVLVAVCAIIGLGLSMIHHSWYGVDETVVEKYANQAGRPARDPIINTDKGDLLLFVFLIAGTAGGFVGGYYFRELFGRDSNK